VIIFCPKLPSESATTHITVGSVSEVEVWAGWTYPVSLPPVLRAFPYLLHSLTCLYLDLLVKFFWSLQQMLGLTFEIFIGFLLLASEARGSALEIIVLAPTALPPTFWELELLHWQILFTLAFGLYPIFVLAQICWQSFKRRLYLRLSGWWGYEI